MHSKHFARDLESWNRETKSHLALRRWSQAAKIQVTVSCTIQRAERTERPEASASSSLELLVLQEMKDIVGSLEERKPGHPWTGAARDVYVFQI